MLSILGPLIFVLIVIIFTFKPSSLQRLNQNHAISQHLVNCDQLIGLWAGSGDINAAFVRCQYHQLVTITSGSDMNSIMLDIKLTKESGACPTEESIQLKGTCINGIVKLQTNNASFNLSMNNEDTAIDLSGFVYIEVKGLMIRANVTDVHLQKQ